MLETAVLRFQKKDVVIFDAICRLVDSLFEGQPCSPNALRVICSLGNRDHHIPYTANCFPLSQILEDTIYRIECPGAIKTSSNTTNRQTHFEKNLECVRQRRET